MHEQPDSREELNRGTKEVLVRQYKDRIARNTSRVFIALMLLQWIGAIVTAAIVSPRTWSGVSSSLHVHVWAALFLGGIITVFPVWLARVYPTPAFTRHVVSPRPVVVSALL